MCAISLFAGLLYSDLRILASMHKAGYTVARVCLVDPMYSGTECQQSTISKEARMHRRAVQQLAAFWPSTQVWTFANTQAYR